MKLVKHAFCDLLTQLLDPLTSLATAEVNLPTLIRFVSLILPKAIKMSGKKDHAAKAIPLCASLLCISSQDLFSKNWSQFIEALVTRPKERKDRIERHVVVTGMLRLVWVYLFRDVGGDGSDVGQNKMDGFFRQLLPANRRNIIPGIFCFIANEQLVRMLVRWTTML
jgi:hypothetical protein